MNVYIIVKDTTDYPQDIAHLYEHWFIMSFYQYAHQKAGMHGGAIGYIGGETYNNIIFIEAWFYDDEASRLFEEFCANEILAPDQFSICMQQCQSEDRVLWSIHDQKLLDSQLDGLRQLDWRPGDDITPYVYSDDSKNDQLPITIRKAAAQYKAVTITVNLPGAPLEDQAVFLRFYVIITDIIGQFVQQKGWHGLDILEPRQNKDGIYAIAGVSLPRGGTTNSHLAAEVTDYLRAFDVTAQMNLIQAHFNEYASHATWKGRMREELHHVDVIASNRSIAELATEERVRRILQSVVVSVDTEPYSFAKDIPY